MEKDDASSSSDSAEDTWAWRPPSEAAAIERRREAAERASMQSYYDLEHLPGHRFEFQQRVRTNKSFDARRERSASQVRLGKGKENVRKSIEKLQRSKSEGGFVPPRSVSADLTRRKWRVKDTQTLREFPSKQARARAELEEQLRQLRSNSSPSAWGPAPSSPGGGAMSQGDGGATATTSAPGSETRAAAVAAGAVGRTSPTASGPRTTRTARVPFEQLFQPFAASRLSCQDLHSIDSSALSFVDPFHKTAVLGQRVPGFCKRGTRIDDHAPYCDPGVFAHGLLPTQTLTVKTTSMKQLHPADSIDVQLPTSLTQREKARRQREFEANSRPVLSAHVPIRSDGSSRVSPVAAAAARHARSASRMGGGQPIKAWDSTSKKTTDKLIWRRGAAVV